MESTSRSPVRRHGEDSSWVSDNTPSVDSVIAWQYRFLDRFRQKPKQLWNKRSIYKIPYSMKDLNDKAYHPRVVSIGPYHNGNQHLQPMEEHKYRALRHFLNRAYDIRLEDLVGHFRDDYRFMEKVINSYSKPIDPQWNDNYALPHLMILDGCFVLELLLSASANTCSAESPASEWCYAAKDPIFGDHEEKHGIIPYVKLDMLLVENQIPLIVLHRLSRIAQLEVNLNDLIRSFYGCRHPVQPIIEPLGLHVLDVYRKGRLFLGEYTGWTVPMSAKELGDHGIRFKRSSGGGSGDGNVGIGGFKDVVFKIAKKKNICGKLYDHFMEPLDQRRRPRPPPQIPSSVSGFFRKIFSPLRLIPTPAWPFPFAPQTAEWYITSVLLWIITAVLSVFFYLIAWWYLPLWVIHGDLYLPFLTIDEATEPILLNLMAFEFLHLGREGRDMGVTHYVFLMSSLIRSEEDVKCLRKNSILSSLPERSDMAVVKLFADITRNVVVDDGKGVGMVRREISDVCARRPNRWQASWIRNYGFDLKTWISVILTVYGVMFALVSSIMNVLNYINRKIG